LKFTSIDGKMGELDVRSGGTLLIGYDVESSGDPSIVRRFLQKAEEVHSDLSAPCTFFLVGKVVEANREELAELRRRCDLFDYEQHTYSHMLLKTVCIDDGQKVSLVKGGPPEEIEREVSRTNQILAQHLGVECWGLTGPWGYYRGLCDRPDLLEILDRNGIRFLRTYARNEKDFQPVSFEIQPFWYKLQGFPNLLEMGIHGWQDVYWRSINGWENTKGYLDLLKDTVDMVAKRGLVWSYGAHDWSAIKSDSEMSVMRGFIQYAKDRGLRMMDYRSFYLEALKARAP